MLKRLSLRSDSLRKMGCRVICSSPGLLSYPLSPTNDQNHTQVAATSPDQFISKW